MYQLIRTNSVLFGTEDNLFVVVSPNGTTEYFECELEALEYYVAQVRATIPKE